MLGAVGTSRRWPWGRSEATGGGPLRGAGDPTLFFSASSTRVSRTLPTVPKATGPVTMDRNCEPEQPFLLSSVSSQAFCGSSGKLTHRRPPAFLWSLICHFLLPLGPGPVLHVSDPERSGPSPTCLLPLRLWPGPSWWAQAPHQSPGHCRLSHGPPHSLDRVLACVFE